MGKTRAQIQREYRERKKKNDPAFLEREKQRQRKYRVSANELSEHQLRRRRSKNRLYSSRYRENIRQLRERIASQEQQSPVIQSSAVDSPRPTLRSSPSPLQIRFRFPVRRKEIRRSKALRTAKTKIKNLEKKNAMLRRRIKTIQRRDQREKHNHNLTPRRQTRRDLRGVPVDVSLRKKVLFANVITAQLRETAAAESRKRGHSSLRQITSGRIIKKYRMMRTLSVQIDARRKTLAKSPGKTIKRITYRGQVIREVRNQVMSFYERDDVSRCLPGKRDVTKCGQNEKRQTRILNDYLTNLFKKFIGENPTITLGLTAFCSLRPEHVKLTSALSRNVCLCAIHQNIAFKLKTLVEIGIDCPVHPEKAASELTLDRLNTLLACVNADYDIEYEQWMKVKRNDGKKRMTIKKVKCSIAEFKEIMMKDYESFLGHIHRMKEQFKALRDLKQTLPAGHVIVQMDFAENFTCVTADEVQSAYWNQEGVTLHPTVVYYGDPSTQLQHISYVFVSELGEHNASAVVTIMKKLVSLIKTALPGVKMIHYFTDSPSSQYRNRFVFNMVRLHESIFGVSARWNYFESGHGKSVCDGIGGTSKRQAADAVKQGKATIQCAEDYFAWGTSCEESKIQYELYTRVEYDEAETMVNSLLDSKPFPGTMKIHAVVPAEDRKSIFVRETSCYCSSCLAFNGVCDGWTRKKANKANQQTSVAPANVGEYVAALYGNKWYIGIVKHVDEGDKDMKITFMKETRGVTCMKHQYKWPSPPDCIWTGFEDILTTIQSVTPVGRSERAFFISEEEHRKITQLFNDKVKQME